MTLYVNHKMMAEEAAQCKKAVFIDHGVDYDAFANAALEGLRPEEWPSFGRP